jgi:hypothetical protein
MKPEVSSSLSQELPLANILSQIIPVHDLPADLFKISFNIIPIYV